jgi:hypothetical protein
LHVDIPVFLTLIIQNTVFPLSSLSTVLSQGCFGFRIYLEISYELCLFLQNKLLGFWWRVCWVCRLLWRVFTF